MLCVFSVQLLISCRLYTDCCAHVVLCVLSVQLLISCSLYTDCCAHVVLCVFSLQLLISCSLYTDCCAHVAGNPWHCDCDSMYTVYQTFREGTGLNVTLRCDSPAELRGTSWDVLEVNCERTVTPPQSAVTGSTANTTALSTSQPAESNSSVQHMSLQESSPDAFHSPSTFIVIFVLSLALAVFIAVLVVNKAVKRLRRGTGQLDRLWWEDVVARIELMSG